jgi:hypothetical protein
MNDDQWLTRADGINNNNDIFVSYDAAPTTLATTTAPPSSPNHVPSRLAGVGGPAAPKVTAALPHAAGHERWRVPTALAATAAVALGAALAAFLAWTAWRRVRKRRRRLLVVRAQLERNQREMEQLQQLHQQQGQG